MASYKLRLNCDRVLTLQVQLKPYFNIQSKNIMKPLKIEVSRVNKTTFGICIIDPLHFNVKNLCEVLIIPNQTHNQQVPC